MGFSAAAAGDGDAQQSAHHRPLRASARRSAGCIADGRLGDFAEAVQSAGAHRADRASFAVIADRIAAKFPTRFLKHYVRGIVTSDPLYDAVYERLRGRDDPILDVGCGTGLLALYLKERGHR